MTTEAMAPPTPPPLTLVAPGKRDVIDEKKAHAIVEGWTSLLDAQEKSVRSSLRMPEDSTDPLPDDIVLCDKIVLTDKSYTAAAAVVIASFLTRGERPVASGITKADLSDVIASRPEDEALQVLQTLCDAFERSSLVEVDLSDNALGSKGISACSTVLSGQSGTLQSLSLCNNGLSEASMDEVADILTAGADETDNGCVAENLTKIHFFNNMSGNGGCHAFARILNRCTDKLVDVRFSGTRAGREGSQIVASALDGLGDRVKNLRRLDLADNTFGVDGAGHLSHMLGRCRNLTHLNLHDCICEDEGIKLICHSLWSSDAPLEELNVSGNEITRRAGTRALADLLEENCTIRSFHAEENELTSLGVKAIMAALLVGADDKEGAVCAVEEIVLGTNQIGRIGAAAILDAYGPGGENMPNLTKIDLNGNMFCSEDVEALENAFGDMLIAMDDNDDEDDIDDQLSDDEEEEEEGDDDGDVGHEPDADVDALTAAVAGATLDHDLT